MKKYISLFVAIVLSFAAANASDKVHVAANTEFNTAAPAKSIDVTVIESTLIGTNLLEENDILHCSVVKITDPKRGKRAASFAVCPLSYTTSEGTTKAINGSFYGKYSEKVLSKDDINSANALKVGKKAAVSVGNHFVKGVAPAVALAEGMIKNEDGNRLESGVKQVYKDSPLSYVEKGKDIVIERGDTFYFVFKPSKSKNTQEIETEADADNSED